jgi:cytochrome d ubiquinol oxidase subunit I
MPIGAAWPARRDEGRGGEALGRVRRQPAYPAGARSGCASKERRMDNLLFARLQMAMSLGFHIVFAVIGIGMPLLMVIAEWRWLRTGSEAAKRLTKNWAKGTAVFFAVGAVSGTVLSFELGLLWPRFMAAAGGIIGFPFSLEGFAFFTEAIFLGIYLYGWDRIHRWAHWGAGIIVALSGAASAVFVVMANAWMNAPAGFTFDPATGEFSNIDPIAAMFNPMWKAQALHMVIAAYMATAFAAAGVHALHLRRDPRDKLHREALGIAMAVAVIAAIAQPISGDYAAARVAERQPVKLAAMEGQFRTEAGAPLRIGGLPDERSMRTRYALEIPKLLSFLAYRDANAVVRGLEDVPRDQWPPVAPTHLAFQAMVGSGTALLLAGLWFLGAAWRPGRGWRLPTGRGLLLFLVLCTPLGFLAVEAGWIVTEVGRQPWIISGVMRVSDAVTPMPGLVVPFVTFTVIYVFLAAVVAIVFYRQVRAAAPARGAAVAPEPPRAT